jgi:hypothetical protein
MPEKELSKLKKYINDRILCLKDKKFSGPQGERATYDEGHINGELLAFEQMLHEIEKRERFLRWAAEIDEVACELSYELEPDADAISIRIRQGLYEHIKAELQGYFHTSRDFKWRRARSVAAKYMYDRTGGGK